MGAQTVLEESPESPGFHEMSVRPEIALIVGVMVDDRKPIGGLNAQSIVEPLFDKDEII